MAVFEWPLKTGFTVVYKCKRIVGKSYFSDQFKKIVKRYKGLDMAWISCDSLHAWLFKPNHGL